MLFLQLVKRLVLQLRAADRNLNGNVALLLLLLIVILFLLFLTGLSHLVNNILHFTRDVLDKFRSYAFGSSTFLNFRWL